MCLVLGRLPSLWLSGLLPLSRVELGLGPRTGVQPCVSWAWGRSQRMHGRTGHLGAERVKVVERINPGAPGPFFLFSHMC